MHQSEGVAGFFPPCVGYTSFQRTSLRVTLKKPLLQLTDQGPKHQEARKIALAMVLESLV